MRAVLAATCLSGVLLGSNLNVAAAAPRARGHGDRDTSPAATAASGSLRAAALTPEMVVAIRGVGDVQVAPNGRRVAYVVSVPRAAEDLPGPAYQEIWMVDTDGAGARRFTPAEQRAWAPAFSPDGLQLAFLSTRPTPGTGEDDEETTDLFVLPVDGGEARLLTDGEHAVSLFRWSPGGESIAFTARDPESAEEKADKKAGRDQVVADANPKMLHLWSVDVASAQLRQLTDGTTNVIGLDWSPDGSRLVLRTTETPRVDDDYMHSALALLPAAGGAPVPFVTTRGKLDRPQCSPRGGWVAWLGALDLNDPFAGSVFVASASGGEPVNLTSGLQGCVTWIGWLDEETLVAAVTRGTHTSLELLSRRGGAPRTLCAGGPVFTEASLSRQGGVLALSGSTPLRPAEVFAGRVARAGVQLRRLTSTNPDLDRVQLGAQETVRWKAADGIEIEGLLVRPPGFVSGQRYPLVVVVHGGPESCFRDGWVTSWGNGTQLLARRGYVVLLPNYRGSIGRGDDFERADHGDVGGKEFEDVLAGIDFLGQRGWIDPERVGIGGGSYGGYFTAWAATAHSQRFAAAADFAGITNWLSMQGTSDIPEENALVHWNLPFHEHMDLYWERSPIAHVNQCRTPVLIGHGEKDARVPIGQGAELYTALRLLGRDVEYVCYPREGHGLREAAHQLDYLKRSLAWFDRNLKPASGVSRR